MSDLRKWLGLSSEDEALARKLASPADMAAEGATSIGESASRVLGGLGAKLDARLGTTPRGPRPKEIDPLMPQETTPRANLGLFETLGTAVPNVVAATAGNALPISGPAMPGAVAAFPTPKQSFARMKEEAVFRDMMESKGARAIEPAADMGPNGVPVSEASRRAIADYEFANRNYDADPTPAAQEARRDAYRRMFAETTKDLNRINRGMTEASFANAREAQRSIRGTEAAANANREERLRQRLDVGRIGRGPDGPLDFYGVQSAAGQVPATAESAGRILSAAPNPRAKIPAEQTELERYLSGLFGPRAK